MSAGTQPSELTPENTERQVDLAKALWPTMERKIQRRQVDESAPTPEIAGVIWEAYIIAQQWRYRSFVLGAEPQEAPGPRATPFGGLATNDLNSGAAVTGPGDRHAVGMPVS